MPLKTLRLQRSGREETSVNTCDADRPEDGRGVVIDGYEGGRLMSYLALIRLRLSYH